MWVYQLAHEKKDFCSLVALDPKWRGCQRPTILCLDDSLHLGLHSPSFVTSPIGNSDPKKFEQLMVNSASIFLAQGRPCPEIAWTPTGPYLFWD